jgi:predicted flap endonuclease-1-like 5' DNA nuclease
METDMANIEDIEGIGPAYGAKLVAAGIKTTDALLEQGGTKAGRGKIAEDSGITETLILEWVNRADLARIHGIGSEYADLLEASGVDSVPELAQRVPANLHKKMEGVNAEKNLVRRLPTESEVEKWVAEAKTLPKAVHH